MVIVKLPSGSEIDISAPLHYKRRLALACLCYLGAGVCFSVSLACAFYYIYMAIKMFNYILTEMLSLS